MLISSCLVFALTYELGALLVELSTSDRNLTLQLQANVQETISTTMNVLAESQWGKSDSVILVGSHLDSVPAGPGINDNGSGTSANLELAIQIALSGMRFPNKIRFAWWSAEERGLLGSTFYTQNLNRTNPQALKHIALNLNFGKSNA
jgi:Zn-dependent M28 family amino/carboxypeptidase